MNGGNLSQGKNPIGWTSGFHSQESTNSEQVVTSIRILPLPWPIPKYLSTVEPLLKYPIGLDRVVDFFALHKSLICD